MDGRSTSFYGTPLSRSHNHDREDIEDHRGPITIRRARLNQQQIVHDDQGRRRFHGAFTGGFSAGYYNSVGTVQGFQPKSFVSHRREKRQQDGGATSLFDQKPEDFMDEEDLSEFGIAPKKIRMLGEYQPSGSSKRTSSICAAETRLASLLQPVAVSIGEKILRRMSGIRGNKIGFSIDQSNPYPIKADLHGLGYTPLRVEFNTKNRTSNNPLQALFSDGKRLKISGEAFGDGVLDDDDDQMDNADEYGYDDIKNYDCSRTNSQRSRQRTSKGELSDERDTDQQWIDGFVLASDQNTRQPCDNIYARYPLPVIDPEWQMPSRSEQYYPPQTEQSLAQQKLNWERTRESASSFNMKFTSGTSHMLAPDVVAEKAGLLLYTDIVASDKTTKVSKRMANTTDGDNELYQQASISREILEWRPCSLLCKRFNVPNPYPDNAYFGSKRPTASSLSDEPKIYPASTSRQDIDKFQKHHADKVAVLELRRSIFNMTFEADDNRRRQDDQEEGQEDSSESENEPQILEEKSCDLVAFDDYRTDIFQNADRETADSDTEILIVTAPKREPELIVLSSSTSSCSSQSSSSSSSSSPLSTSRLAPSTTSSSVPKDCADKAASKRPFDQRRPTSDEDDEDAYGPPLPPAQQALVGLDKSRLISSGKPSLLSRSKHKKKMKKSKKKQRKHKRERNKND